MRKVSEFLDWLGTEALDMAAFAVREMPLHAVLAGLALLVMLLGGLIMVLG